MQYALIAVREGTERLLDANELAALNRYGDTIAEQALADEAGTVRLVYGAYLPQRGGDLGEALDAGIREGFAYGHIQGAQCHLTELCEIALYEPLRVGQAVRVPFAARGFSR